jgi:molecular chaperone HscC
LNPDELIALGAAVQAGLKMRDAALDEVVMTDVSPYTMGMETSRQMNNQYVSGFYLPIIERNSVVPVSRVMRVNTVHDNQTEVNVRIFQGESPQVRDNVFLGELHIKVPPRPARHTELDVRFTYDVNGLLEAEVKVVETGAVHTLLIEENPGVLSQEEIKKRMAELDAIKIHPRDQTENRALLARAERIYQEMLGREREAISDALVAFQAALESQDGLRIREVRGAVAEMLNQVEGVSPF